MVRLMLTLTPVVCMLGGIALNVTFDHFFAGESQVADEKPAEKQAKVKGRVILTSPICSEVRNRTEDRTFL